MFMLNLAMQFSKNELIHFFLFASTEDKEKFQSLPSVQLNIILVNDIVKIMNN